jgi:hypothetical protein
MPGFDTFGESLDHYLLHWWAHHWSLCILCIVAASAFFIWSFGRHTSLLRIVWQLQTEILVSSAVVPNIWWWPDDDDDDDDDSPHTTVLQAICCVDHMPVIHNCACTWCTIHTTWVGTLFGHYISSKACALFLSLIFPIAGKIWRFPAVWGCLLSHTECRGCTWAGCSLHSTMPLYLLLSWNILKLMLSNTTGN